ncbi:MAG: nucleotidyltransferase substrate binding protein [Acidobacteria bacterium]|nr:nucleotidyltransferase substrate binding protein [Acidobacteriota bacterium]
MERLRERLATAQHALKTLADILLEPRSPIVRDASIQRFEYTFEAVWKTAQLFLRDVESLDVGSPKSAIRASFRVGLLTEDQANKALAMADDRNLTVHTYNEALAEQICSHLPDHVSVMSGWLSAMQGRLE